MLESIMTWFDGVKAEFVLNFISRDRWKMLLTGLENTLMMTAGALLIGVLIGVIVAVIRSVWETNGKNMKGLPKFILRILDKVCLVYTTVIRGTPMVVQLLIGYWVVLPLMGITVNSGIPVAVIMFGLNSGAYVSEIMRGGINSVEAGQMEAGRSVGLTYATTMLRIVVPQAVKNILPTLGNEFIVLIKETSIVSFIAVTDLYKSFKQLGDPTYNYTMPYLMLALTYLVMVLLISWGVRALEARMKKSER